MKENPGSGELFSFASLEESVDVDPACDLADEDGREALGAQPLVHAQEVDLHHLHSPKRQTGFIIKLLKSLYLKNVQVCYKLSQRSSSVSKTVS